MSFILDVILIAILVFFIATAVKKGFMLSLLELVAVVASFAIAFMFSPTVAQGVYDGFVEQTLLETLKTQLSENVNSSGMVENIQLTISSLPEFVVDFVDSLGVDIESISSSISSADLSVENLATELVTKVAEPMVVGVLTIISFIILAIVLCIALKFVAKILSKAFNLPIVGKVNKTLGGILGGIKGVVVLIFICTILNLAFSNGDGEFNVAVQNSFVINFLDKINPFIESLKELL